MRIGQYDQRITFQRMTETVSDTAAPTQTWADLATCWAWAMSKDGQEFNEANKLTPKHYWIIKTRYRNDITEKDRIAYGSKLLYISSISHDSSRSDATEFLCTEYPTA